jgi:hypothetical protein
MPLKAQVGTFSLPPFHNLLQRVGLFRQLKDAVSRLITAVYQVSHKSQKESEDLER